MVDNNQGFAAVVSAIERLRDTAYNNTGLRISVSRARLMEEKKQTDEIKKLANDNRQLKGKQGQSVKEQNSFFRNLMNGRGITGKGYTQEEAKAAALKIQKQQPQGLLSKRMTEEDAKAAALRIQKQQPKGLLSDDVFKEFRQLLRQLIIFVNGETPKVKKSRQSNKADAVEYSGRDKYAVVLGRKLEKSRQKAGQNSLKNRGLSIPDQKSQIQSSRIDIEDQLGAFRRAIADGQNQLAIQLGERILLDAENIKQAYRDIEKAFDNPQDQKSIQSQIGYITQLQNEVVKGKPNTPGKANKGIIQIADQEFQSAQLGDQTAKGFVGGINGQIDQLILSGEILGKSALKGAKKSLGIASPSREAELLAEYFVDGWVVGLRSIGTSTDKALTEQSDRLRKRLKVQGQKRNSEGRYKEGNPEQPRDKQGRYIAESVQEQIAEIALEIKNLAIRGENVTLIANKVNLASGENAKSTELRLAKAIAAEIRSKPLQVKTSLMGQLSAGFAFAFSQQISKGFGRGTKKNTGIDTEDIGYGLGNFVTNPMGATAEGIGFRRRSRVQNSADLAREMAEKEKVDIDNNRENIFTVGGMGAKGKGGVYVAKEVESAFGKQKVKAIPFKTKNTDPLSDALKDPIEFAVDMYWNYINNLFLQGANPDAIKLAAKVIAAKKKNKNAKIQLVGHSQGGLVVEEAIAILAEAGISDVQGTGLGTPDAGIGYETKGQYRSVFGRTDEIATSGMAQAFPRQGKNQDVDNIPGVADLTGHKIGDYLNHPESLDRIAPDQKWAVIEKALDSQIDSIIREAKVSAKLGKSGAMSPQSLQKVGDRLIGEIRAGKQLIEESGQKSLAPFLDEYRQLSEQLGAVFPGLKADFEKLLQTFQSPSDDPRNVEAESSPEFDISPLQTAIADLRMEFDGLAAAIAGIRVLIEGTTEQATEPTPATEETPPDAPQTTAGKYGNYLQGIIAEARQTAEESIRALIPNFKSLGIQQKRDAAAGYNKGLQAQVKEYRKAVKAGDLALASELGEKLLADAQTVGKVYDDILAAVPDDYVGTKSLQTQRGQVTRIQNEVLAGDKGSGRSPVGLPDLVSNVEEMAGAGDNAAQGYLDGLLARIGGANQGGAAIGDATLDGLDQALDMHSPSEEMRKRGEMAGVGFEIGLVKSLKDAGQAAKAEINKLKATIAKDLEYFRAVATGDTAKAQAMVGDAAKGSGYNVGPVYHGTGEEFNEFITPARGWNYFAQSREKVPSVVKKDRIIEAFLKTEKAKGSPKRGVFYGDVEYSQSDKLKKKGFDTVYARDEGGVSVAVANPNQIKSADPVTKTDKGVPVPLSARFDDSVSDIRGNVTDVLSGLKSQAGESLQPFIAELETAFTSAGENSIDGLIGALEGALGQLRDLGGDIGETLAKGTEDALDIDSPSKVYKAIGKNIIAGLEQGLTGFEGTLEEKRQLLKTYVKSVIELVYDFKKVMGEAETPAQEVRKLFQEIGKAGTATPEQLDRAKGYFPQVAISDEVTPSGAGYRPEGNQMFLGKAFKKGQPDGMTIGEVSGVFAHEYTHALQANFDRNPDEIYNRALTTKGGKLSGNSAIANAAKASAKRFVSQVSRFRLILRKQLWDFSIRQETEAYANQFSVNEQIEDRGFFKADAANQVPFYKRLNAKMKPTGDTQGMAAIAENATDSLTQSVDSELGNVKEAGADIGQSLLEGTENALQIESPSKVYKAIGKNIIAGLMQGMDGFEGTLEEKEKILETYVKSVIELIYSFKKVTGKPMGEADAVRKLFQEIGQEGTATPAQLAKAQKYFPQVERLPDSSPGVALYNPKQNKIKIKQGRDLDKLSADLVHEYTHAIQARFGVGMRFATTPADFFPKTAMSPKGEKHLGDPRVDKASDASANYLMGAFEITPEQGRRYETQFNHVKRRESEAYANELGVGTEQQRRGFFKADADEIAAKIKAAREETKKAAAELKQAAEQQAKTVKEAGAKVGKAFADGVEEGKQTIGDRLNGFLDWLEGIPVVGQLVKWGRQLAGAIAGLFGKKEQPKPQAQKPKPVQPKPVPVAVATPEVVTTQPAKPAEVQISPVEVAEQIEEIIEPVTQIEVQPETAPEPTAIEVAPIEVAQEIEETIGNAIDPQRQADRWLAYISQWAKNLGKTFDDSIGAEITELKASGKNIAQELRVKIDKVGNGLEQRQKQFRQAIADGNAQVAKAVGTELVEQSEQLRVLYKRMAENVKFAEGRGTWRDQAAEMTKVQKEAIKGYPNLKGRAKTGAWQAIAANTADGFTQGMEKELSDAEQSGYDLGEAAITGAKKALGIKSPSKEFLDIAKNVVEGWNNGLDALGDDAANNVRRFMRSISDGTDQAIQDIDQGIGQIFTTIGNAFPILKTFKGVILAIGAGFLIDAALGAIVENFSQFALGAFDSVVAAESLTRSFVSLTGSSAKAQKSMAYAATTAQKLGVDLKTAEDAYKGMIATTRGSALEGLQTDQIFYAFSDTAAARGLNNEEQQRMFAAIQQMLSKNKLSAEEVRGQLGEISALDFQGTLARSMGVSVAQLDEAMSSGSLMASDVLPKVAAQYAAENAIVANSSETTAQAMTRYSNALELLRRSMGEWFSEAKYLFSAAATGIELITKVMPALIQWVSALGLVMAWNSVSLFAALVKIPIVSKIVAIALRELGKAIGFILSGPGLKMLATYAAQIILIQLAFDAVSAAVNTTQNRFTEYAKAIDTTRKAVEAMEAAQAKLNKTQSQAGKNLPTKPGDVVTDQTWKPFGIDTGINLEPVRQTLGLTTLGEKQMNDFKIMASENSQQVNNVLSEGYQVTGEVEKITEIDRQLAIVRSRRFENIRGDKQAYEESVKAEKELLAKREEVLAYTSTYQASLDSAITSVEQRLADIEAMKTRGGITQDEANYQTTMAEAELADLKKARTEFEKLTNALTQSVNGLEREMRNLNEQTTAFNESLDRTATNNRVAFLRQASASGTGSTIRDMGLSALASNDSQARVGFLRDRLSSQELLLSDPEFAAIAEELRQQAAALGTDLENTATLDRIIAENRDGTTTQVAQLIKEILDTKTQLGQAEEQIAQSLIDQRGALTDLNRTIADFFQQLTQQFEEARIELDRVKNQLRYGGLKQKLQKALVPGSNSFINGVIGSIQGIFDQASSVMEAVLGQRSARLSFAGEKYSLDNQMTDFARSVNGATQAVEAFRASLAGGQATLNGAGQSGAVATNRGGGFTGTFGQNTVMSLAARYGLNKNSRAGNHFGSRRAGSNTHHGVGNAVDFGDAEQGVSKQEAHRKFSSLVKELMQNGMVAHVDEIIWNGHGSPLGDYFATGGKGPFFKIQNGQRVPIGSSLAGTHTDHLHMAETTRGGGAYSPNQTAIAGNANTGGDRQAINALLKRFNSKMTADDFYAVSQATGVQVDALVTQAMIESGFGTTGRGRRFNNPLNWGNDDAGNNKAFPTLRDGLMAGAQGLKDKFNFTSPEQFIANQFRGKYGVYATDPQYKQKYQSALSQVRSAGVGGNVATNVSYAQPQQQTIVATTPDPAIARAQALTGRLTGIKSAIVDGNGQLAQQQINGFLLEVNQQKQALDRQLDDATRMANNTIAESRNAFADLMQQYSPQTLDSQTAAEVRQANNTLRQQFNELFERRREQEDGIQGAKTAIAEMQGIITILENRKNDVAPEQAVIDRAQIDLLKSAIPTLQNEVIPAYEKALAVTKEQEAQLNSLKTTMESWLQTQAKQRQLDQNGEMIALRLSVAQASYNEQLKLQRDFETVDNDYEKRKLLEEQRLINQPELLKEVLTLLEKERDLKKQALQYDFDALIRGRELEAVSRQLGLAQSSFNLEKIRSLELAQAELEAKNKEAEILEKITDKEEQRRQLALTEDERKLKERDAEFKYINGVLARKQGDRELSSRYAENEANLSRNPFAATQLRENNAVANRQGEFERRAEEIRQQYGDSDLAQSMIAREAEILSQDLELIDREFRDLSETIGDNLGNAFNDFSNALINGDNALQAFTNSLLKAVSDIGSQLMQQGMQGLMQNIFGKSGAIGGLFSGGGSSAGYSIADAIIPAFTGSASAIAGGFTGATAMLPGFAVGGYTGDGGKHEPKGVVHGGEFVINKEATRKIGLPALMTANTFGTLPGYATGGYVGIESRLLSGLNSSRMPALSLPTQKNPATAIAGPVSNTVNVNINDKNSRFFTQPKTLARHLADELRG